jgi:two-component system, OmpR family, KDP operon response regulator KdpE
MPDGPCMLASRSARSAASASVLIVDGDLAILRTMGVNLRARGYEAVLAAQGRQALALAARRHPDVVVLELNLPDLDGFEVIDGLRGWTSVPIIVVSTLSGEAEKVTALDAGANDYMTKPFGIAELMARLRVVLRAQPRHEEARLQTAAFTLDLQATRALRGDQSVQLTATEWRMVKLLVRNPGCLITPAQVLEHVWGLKNAKNNYVRVYLASIRRKLEPDPAHPRYFLTEPRSGIRFQPDVAIRSVAESRQESLSRQASGLGGGNSRREIGGPRFGVCVIEHTPHRDVRRLLRGGPAFGGLVP